MTLTCDVTDGNPRDDIKQVTWKKGDVTIPTSSRYQLSDKDLTISSPNHTLDDGHYSCAAENVAGMGEFSTKFHLQIHYKPIVSVVTPDSVVEGKSVTIICQSQGARPGVTSVSWKKGQEVIKVTTGTKYTGGTVQTPSLTIGPVLKTDIGQYTCQLSNDVGHSSASVTLQVLYKPYGQATVGPEDVTVASAVDAQVSLTCRAPPESGNPAASWFMWSKHSSDFSSNTTGTLSLTLSSVTASGKYRCKAGNWIGQSDYSDWTTVTVQAPAKVEFPRIVNIQQSPAFDDTDFNMTCTVSGSGDPKVEWHKDEVSVDTSDFTVTTVRVTGEQYMYGQTEAKESTLMRKVTKTARHFTCSNITHFDGHYTCTVSTQTAGAMTHDKSKAFIVNVQYEAHWSSGPTMTAAAPNDTSKEIECSVCANPQPTFLWTFKNESLREGIQVVGNKIKLDRVTRNDFGVYQCMANSSINGENRTAVFEVTLLESGPAREPLGFTILSNHTSVALTLRWRPGFHGGHPPQTFTLQYRASNEVALRTWRDMFDHTTDGVTWYQATVTGLKPRTEYVFSLYAENSRPRDKGPNRSETVTQTGSTTAPPQVSLESVKLKEDHMTVTWSYIGQNMRSKRSTSPSVSVVIYYQPHGGEEAHYPPEGSVAAKTREVIIKGKFAVKAKYKVWLKVYEGGLAVSFQQTKPLDAAVEIAPSPTSPSSSPPIAIIAGSTAAVAILIILVISILLCRRHAKNKDCSDVESKPNSMLMANRDNEMVDGYSNVACAAAQEADDDNSGDATKMKKNTEETTQDEDYDDEDGDDVVYTQVTVKSKQGKDVKKKQVAKNPPLASKPVGKENLVGNGKKQKPGKTGNPTTAPKPKLQDKKGKAPKNEEAKNGGDSTYVNTRRVENETDDNLYANVEKSANAESQKPPEDVGPDGTIYADLTFAQAAPAAVKRDEEGDDDDDKVVYAAIDFTTKS